MKLSKQILLAFIAILFLSILDTSFNYLLSVKVEQNTVFLNRSQEIIRNSGRLHKTIIQMQSSFRGYLLSQDTTFLDDYYNGKSEFPLLYDEQKKLVSENKEQSNILDSINILHTIWLNYAEELIGSKRKLKTGSVQVPASNVYLESKMKTHFGKRINDIIATKFSLLDQIEYRIRKLHSNNLIASIKRTHTFSFIFFTLTIVVGVTVTIYIVFLFNRRIKFMVRLAENISKGNFEKIDDRSNDELSGLSRSLNLMSENLNRNINEIKKRNEELDKFAYVVSHDLKAPIRGIHNVIKWISEDLTGEISEKMKHYLDIIPQRTKRMEDLISGLLDYARIRKQTVMEKTDINELVKEIVENVVPKNFTVSINELPVMITERFKMEQVFTNLISNAVKYTNISNGIIIIKSKLVDGHYEFSVKDNGIGIDSEYHSKIFEMFQTLREKDEKESTGIGLAIVKKIIEEKGGYIYVNSKLGEGSEFIFGLPVNTI